MTFTTIIIVTAPTAPIPQPNFNAKESGAACGLDAVVVIKAGLRMTRSRALV